MKLNKENQKPSWWRKYWVEVAIIVLGFGAMNAIFLAKAFRQSNTVDTESAGRLGDFVGGYVGALFALTGIVLLYITLKTQQQASELQSFENKYFELIKMHRDNVAEIKLQGSSRRRVFVLLIRELRCVKNIVEQIGKTFGQKLTQRDVLHIAYYCLFCGVGPNSSRMLRMSLPTFDAAFIEEIEKELNSSETKEDIGRKRKFNYVPFEGHQSRLGHYYRHLYQMIRYVDQQNLNTPKKYEYVKTIRAQLSTHEQALLLVNSLTPIGQDWWRKNLIVKYRLVQNIPREFFESSTELDTSKLFEPGYFEWEEAYSTNPAVEA
jgi:hypothetical protein